MPKSKVKYYFNKRISNVPLKGIELLRPMKGTWDLEKQAIKNTYDKEKKTI